jgi:hypothetical protein
LGAKQALPKSLEAPPIGMKLKSVGRFGKAFGGIKPLLVPIKELMHAIEGWEYF